MKKSQEGVSMPKISVKIELRIGDAVHLLTMDELRELRKMLDALGVVPTLAPVSPYPSIFRDGPLTDPYKVTC